MSLYRKTLLLARKVRNRVAPDDSFSKIDTDVSDVEEASKRIYDGIVGGKPFMVARYGSTELATVVNYLGVKNGIKNPFSYVFGRGRHWWWWIRCSVGAVFSRPLRKKSHSSVRLCLTTPH